MEQQFFKVRVAALLGLQHFAPIRGYCEPLGWRRAEIDCHAVEQGLVVFHMGRLQDIERLGSCRRESFVDLGCGIFAAILATVIHDVIRASRDEKRQAVAVFELKLVARDCDLAAFRKHTYLGFILDAVFEFSQRTQRGPGRRSQLLGRRCCIVSVGQPNDACIRAGFVGRQPHDQNAVGLAAKILTAVGGAVDLIADRGRSSADVQVAAVLRRGLVRRQVDEQIGELLVGTHCLVLAQGIFVASPQAAFVQHDVFGSRFAEDQSA